MKKYLPISILLVLSSIFARAQTDWWYVYNANKNTSELVNLDSYKNTKGGGGTKLLYFQPANKNMTLTVDADFQIHKILPTLKVTAYGQTGIETFTFDIGANKTFTLEQTPMEDSSSTVNRLGDVTWIFKGDGYYKSLGGMEYYSIYKFNEAGELIVANSIWDFTALTTQQTLNGNVGMRAGVHQKYNKLNSNGKSIILTDAKLDVKELSAPTSSTITLNGASALNIDSFTGDVNGYFGSITLSGTSKANITAGEKLNFGTGTVTLNDASEFTIDMTKSTYSQFWTTPIIVNGTSTATLIKNSTAPLHNGNYRVLGDGSTFNITTEGQSNTIIFDVADGAKANITAQSLNMFANKDYVNTWGSNGKGASVNVTGSFAINTGAILTIGANSKVSLSKNAIWLQGILTLNGSNIFTDSTGKLNQADVTKLIFNGNTAKLVLGADNAFDTINIAENIKGSVALQSHKLTFTWFEYNANSLLVFDDFEENKVFYAGIAPLAEDEDGSLTHFKSSNGNGGYNKLYLLDSGYFSMYIPEPSTYAAIIGALALGLAVYRRRK